jgi:hypothetical protein
VAAVVRSVTDTEWVITVATAFSALAAWVALGLSIYNTYTQRRDRTPRVDMVVRWNLPRDLPATKPALGRLMTANPGEKYLVCEITNVGMVGVKITEVYVYIDAPPGRALPMELPEGEHPRRLETGDSQTWSLGPMEHGLYDRNPELLAGGTGEWTTVGARDTAGNTYEERNPDFVRPPRKPG